jgi:hypothetical protein
VIYNLNEQYDNWVSDYHFLPSEEKALWNKDKYIEMRSAVAKYFTEDNASALMCISLFEHAKEFKPELQTVIDVIDQQIEYSQENNYLESLTLDVWRVLIPAWKLREAIEQKKYLMELLAD